MLHAAALASTTYSQQAYEPRPHKSNRFMEGPRQWSRPRTSTCARLNIDKIMNFSPIAECDLVRCLVDLECLRCTSGAGTNWCDRLYHWDDLKPALLHDGDNALMYVRHQSIAMPGNVSHARRRR